MKGTSLISLIRRHPTASFFVFAFVISWTAWVLSPSLVPPNTAFSAFINLIASFGPAFSAILVSAIMNPEPSGASVKNRGIAFAAIFVASLSSQLVAAIIFETVLNYPTILFACLNSAIAAYVVCTGYLNEKLPPKLGRLIASARRSMVRVASGKGAASQVGRALRALEQAERIADAAVKAGRIGTECAESVKQIIASAVEAAEQTAQAVSSGAVARPIVRPPSAQSVARSHRGPSMQARGTNVRGARASRAAHSYDGHSHGGHNHGSQSHGGHAHGLSVSPAT